MCTSFPSSLWTEISIHLKYHNTLSITRVWFGKNISHQLVIYPLFGRVPVTISPCEASSSWCALKCFYCNGQVFCLFWRVWGEWSTVDCFCLVSRYLYYAAASRCRLHRFGEGGLGILAAAAGKDDAAAPAARRSRRDAARSSLVAQPISIFIVVRHVSGKQGSFDTAHRGRPIESSNPLKTHTQKQKQN